MIPTMGATRHEPSLLASLAEAGHGAITSEALSAAGMSGKVVNRMARAGVLTREFHGIYRLGVHRLAEAERLVLACAATRGRISHESAARYWGYTELPELPLHVTVNRAARAPGAEWLQVHSTTRWAGHGVTRDGVLVTKPLRTLLDIARQPIGDTYVTGYVDYSIAHRLFTVKQVERFLTAGCGSMKGVERLCRIVVWSADIDSSAEAEIVRLLMAAGIERPVTRYRIVDRNGRFVAIVDLAWPRLKVALEVDGFAYHSDYRTFVADRDRGNRLVAAGWILLRVAPTSARRAPWQLCTDVQETLALAEAKLARGAA
jgi:very-short-patch-repair endonuclease